MKNGLAPVLLSITVLSSAALVSRAYARVIYGEDNRHEVFQASEKNQRFARSATTMISKVDIVQNTDGTTDIRQTRFADWLVAKGEEAALATGKILLKPTEVNGADVKLRFCADERFVDQPNAGMCSGFLIAPDLIVTAGHCAKIERSCEDYSWVFDFKVDQETGLAGVNVKSENIYTCKRIVSQSLSTVHNTDHAIIQLDRPVTGREPLELRLEGTIADNTEITVIGNPSGLPLKVTDKANVRTNTSSVFFVANLDTFQGNSGSAVFNNETGIVEGILVRGEEDFSFNSTNSCLSSKKCGSNECRGEDVSRILSVPEIALKTLMNSAAEEGDSETLEQILSFNVWVDFYLQDGQTSLMKAAAKGQNIALVTLLARGADANLVDVNGDSALHHLARVISPESAEALHTLVSAGAKLDLKNKAGETPARIAEAAGNVEGLKLFMQVGAPQSKD